MKHERMLTTPYAGSLLDCRCETYDEVINDIKPLLSCHWEEIAVYKDIPLDPDFEQYRLAMEAGLAFVYTARLDGALIGYAIYFSKPGHHHYRGSRWAISDIVWVAPEHRNHHVASSLFDMLEDDLRHRGVDVIHTTAKTDHPELSFFLKSRGHAMIEEGFSKRL